MYNIIHKTTDERLEAFFNKPITDIEPDTQMLEYDWGKPVGDESC